MGNKSTSEKPTMRRYSPEEKARAVRLVRQLRKELGTTHGTVQRVADQIGCGVESLRIWVKQADIDEGVEPADHGGGQADHGAGAAEPRAAARQRPVEAGIGFLRGGARPPLEVIVAFVDENREQFGVEFICQHLQVAPSSYYAAKKRQTAPSARGVRDALMMQILLTLWVANRKVYGAHKLWKAAQRAGHDIGRDQVARLMRELGIEGVSRLRKKVFTTRQDPDATRAPDLVNRQFKADRPDALWVTDLTYVPTRSGMAYVCFIVDAFSRRIVGWRVAANMTTVQFLSL